MSELPKSNFESSETQADTPTTRQEMLGNLKEGVETSQKILSESLEQNGLTDISDVYASQENLSNFMNTYYQKMVAWHRENKGDRMHFGGPDLYNLHSKQAKELPKNTIENVLKWSFNESSSEQGYVFAAFAIKYSQRFGKEGLKKYQGQKGAENPMSIIQRIFSGEFDKEK